MDTIILEGITYTKASILAKRFRYTSDYIGQLCRSGKVVCHMVGRTWYVTESSLLDHKDTRYKEARLDEKTIKYNAREVTESDKISVMPRITKETKSLQNTVRNFESRLNWSAGRYFEDEAELLPQPVVRKRILPQVPPVIEVKPAEAERIAVKIVETPKQKLEFTELPEIPLRGHLTVTDASLAVNDEVLPERPPVKPSPAVLDHEDVKREKVRAPRHATPLRFAPQTVTDPAPRFSPQLLLLTATASSLSLVLFLLFSSQTYVFEGQTLSASVHFSADAMATIWAFLSGQL